MSDIDNNIFEFSIDLNNAEAPNPLPAGSYPFEVRAAEIKAPNNKGNRVLAVDLYISPDSYPVDYTDGNPDGTVLKYQRLVVRDDVQSRFQIRKFQEAIGAKLSNKLDANALIGCTGTVEVVNSEWEGMPRAEAAKIVAK